MDIKKKNPSQTIAVCDAFLVSTAQLRTSGCAELGFSPAGYGNMNMMQTDG